MSSSTVVVVKPPIKTWHTCPNEDETKEEGGERKKIPQAVNVVGAHSKPLLITVRNSEPNEREEPPPPSTPPPPTPSFAREDKDGQQENFKSEWALSLHSLRRELF